MRTEFDQVRRIDDELALASGSVEISFARACDVDAFFVGAVREPFVLLLDFVFEFGDSFARRLEFVFKLRVLLFEEFVVRAELSVF